ncbi:MAG: hypothetical protein AAF268_15900 [Cyanobacteria bacterium P01_A01_bin.3]
MRVYRFRHVRSRSKHSIENLCLATTIVVFDRCLSNRAIAIALMPWHVLPNHLHLRQLASNSRRGGRSAIAGE